MPSILDYYEYAKLATASYVVFDGRPLSGPEIAARADDDTQKRLPLALANQTFNADSAEAKATGQPVWFVPDFGDGRNGYYGNDGTGFAATLFQRGTEKVLAIRGTEPSGDQQLLKDLLQADIAGIGLLGTALPQAVSMVNYILRLKAAPGSDVQQLVIHASATDPGVPFVRATGTLPGTGVYIYFTETTAVRKGLGLIGAGEHIRVTGHSLGGHLAALAARLFPGLIDETYGVEKWGQVLQFNIWDVTSLGDQREVTTQRSAAR